jgi:hypothetical protein
VTGASATRPGLYADPATTDSSLKALCVSGSMNSFASTDSNVTAYSCTIKDKAALATAGVTDDNAADFRSNFAGKNLLLGLSVSDGSFTAVKSQSPIATERNNQIDFNTTPNASGQYGFLATRPASVGGFMDVNPELFANQAAALSFTPEYSAVTVGAGQSFGVVVSKALYQALQANQGITGCATETATDLTPACQPSISKSQYASLINGQNAAGANWAVLGLSSSSAVKICRRGETSGTQAASDAFFLSNRCSLENYGTPSAATDTSATYVVVENSTTGNAKSCVGSTSAYAVGVISAENKNVVGDTWRYVKLDGVAISDTNAGGLNNQNAIDMKYDFNFEFGYVKSNADAAKASLLDGIAATLVNPAIVSGTAGGGTGAGLAGLFVSPLSGITHSANAAVSKSSRYGNACLPNSYVF